MRFSKKHIPPYGPLIELRIWAELKNSVSLLRPWGSDRWDRHLFLKRDENRQRRLFQFALLLDPTPKLPSLCQVES